MARVYLDTSFVSACVTSRNDVGSAYRRRASRLWWDTQRMQHDVFISVEVIEELSNSSFLERDKALRFVANVPLLEIDDDVRAFARELVAAKVMPGPVVGDAVHVAVAAVHGCRFLISWNVRHLANPNKTRHLHVICRRSKLIAPTIATPDLLWSGESQDEDA